MLRAVPDLRARTKTTVTTIKATRTAAITATIIIYIYPVLFLNRTPELHQLVNVPERVADGRVYPDRTLLGF